MQELRDKQLRYEIESDNAAQAQRLQELILASRKGDPELPRAQALIGRMADTVIKALGEVLAVKTRGHGGKYKSWLAALPLDVAAIISIRECIRLCTGMNVKIVTVQALCTAVGQLFELEVRIRQAEKVNPVYVGKVKEQVKTRASKNIGHLRRLYNVVTERVFKGELELELTRQEIVQIGKFGVDACYKAGLLELTTGTNSRGTLQYYTLHPEVEAYLTGYNPGDVSNLIAREETRMLCPPDEFTDLVDGGYLSRRRKLLAPLMNVNKLRKSVRKEVLDEFTAEKMPLVFSAGNYMQSIAFTFHEPTRAAVLRLWRSGVGSMGLPTSNGPTRPEFPFSEDWDKATASEYDLEVFNKWKRRMVHYHDDVRSWKGKARELGALLKATSSPGDPVWFPVYMDTRGRWYYRGTPNPQGSDAARAMIHFHQKKPLGKRGLFWLRVSIANAFGYDKTRFTDREKWTKEREQYLFNGLDEPENTDVWDDADAPWCAYTAVWELREAVRSGAPEMYSTGIPVHMDATCSGLQHFSALLRDEVGAKYVNLIDAEGGKKEDIYSKVADTALEIIKENESAMAQWVVQTGIPRALAKKPVMTYVYRATLRGTAQYVEHWLETELFPQEGITWPDPAQSYKYSEFIARALFKAVDETVPSATNMMDWLVCMVRQHPKNTRMQWRTPSGFLVQHDYQEFENKRVMLNSCGITSVFLREFKDGTRAHAMQNAISPNFVHALDAAHLTFVANKMREHGVNFVAIHDSFGTHPGDVDMMQHEIRSMFESMYRMTDPIKLFLDGIGADPELQMVPCTGTLNLQEILASEFMFS